MIKNIIFSTTRQWNPGDEIILKGVINLLKSLDIKFNPLIFNRNPDIRSIFGVNQYGKKADFENELWHYTKSAMMDNSVKPWTCYKNIDAIIFAGTPEWQGGRSRELYINAIKYNIPVYLIGIDSVYNDDDIAVSSILEKAKFISIRNKKIRKSFEEKQILCQYLPCPSIFSCETEKKINQVKCIGLIYRGDEKLVTYGNGWCAEKYQSQNNFFRKIVQKYKKQYKIIIICHYIDELHFAQEDFPAVDVRYSYDSAEYINIYNECDLVIGSRIHGIGIATSMGIPSIPIKYDRREGTIDGFYPEKELFYNVDGIEAIDKCLLYISEMNQELIIHKKQTLIKYQNILKKVLDFEKVNYDYNLIDIENNYEEIKDYCLCKYDINIYNQLMERFVRITLDYMNKLIEGKRIIIKGGGLHTKELLKHLTNKVNIICIADNRNISFEGYSIIQNDKIKEIDFDYIIISSYRFECEMLKEIKKLGFLEKTLSLYRIFKDNFGFIDRDFFWYLQ